MPTLEALRCNAVARSLFFEPSLKRAVARLGFVQADPIRAPARAQDLILRQRVPGYRAGDLETQFGSLGIAEHMLHVYGFVAEEDLGLFYPRTLARSSHVETQYPRLRRAVLSHLERHGPTHPRVLHQALGRQSVVNGWGGNSAATTRMLEALHYEGRVAVVRREAGIRVFGLRAASPARGTPVVRLDGLIKLLVNLYAPVSMESLRQILVAVHDRKPAAVDALARLDRLVKRGQLRIATCDDVRYLWPADDPPVNECAHHAIDRVALLAPFDPVVWDRRRFEHLWGWRYRLEAYMPQSARRFGYYALPVLWRTSVVGWANARVAGGRLKVELGYIGKPPRAVAFRHALEDELTRLEQFLGATRAERAAPLPVHPKARSAKLRRLNLRG